VTDCVVQLGVGNEAARWAFDEGRLVAEFFRKLENKLREWNIGNGNVRIGTTNYHCVGSRIQGQSKTLIIGHL
jgi:hypothetical protein